MNWTLRTLIVLLLSCAGLLRSLNYSDLQALRADCYPGDSCSNVIDASQSDFLSRNCECDPLCHLYNDCCVDADNEARQTHRTLNVQCMRYSARFQGVYAINKCSRKWKGPPDLRRKCEQAHDMSDPLMAAPATHPEQGITFKNRYCAECNGVDHSNLQTWGIGLKCESLSAANCSGQIPWNYPEDHLIYKTTYPYRNTWGVYYRKSTQSRIQFHPCKIRFVLPDYLSKHVRFCRPDLISTCSPEWKLDVLRQQCEAYMAVVYISDIMFRNPHCALCNNVDVPSRSCSVGIVFRQSPAISFMMLLDVNIRDGNRVGRIQQNSCPQGQIWDPFFKRCRALECALPGYTMRNERCERQ